LKTALVLLVLCLVFGLVGVQSVGAQTPGTKRIIDNATGGDCTSIGTWNTAIKTCILTTDFSSTIQIDSNGITLDGNGKTLTGSNKTGNGVYLNGKTGVTIKNLTVKQFEYGIFFERSSNNTLSNVTAMSNGVGIEVYVSSNNILSSNNASSNRWDGISLYAASSNDLTGNTAGSNSAAGISLNVSSDNNLYGNTASFNSMGIYVRDSAGNILNGNTTNSNSNGIRLDSAVSNNLYGNTASANSTVGIYLDNSSSLNNVIGNIASANYPVGIWLNYSSANAIIGNTVSNPDNSYATQIQLHNSSNNQIFNNNFITNPARALVFNGSGNTFSKPAPVGGNYWSGYDSPSEGCNNVNGDSFCDAAYNFSGGLDNLPWTTRNGWMDGIAPTTTDNSPSAWQRANFSVALTCTDNPGGSGCKETRYRVDGSVWQTGNSVSINTDGDHLVEYYSTDNTGNQETVKSARAKLDKIAPVVAITSPATGAQFIQGEVVLASWSSYDALSGLASTTAPAPNGQPIDTSLAGARAFTVVSTDLAGNVTSVANTYTVLSPAQAIQALITMVNNLNLSRGVENSLTSKLDAAFASLQRGQNNAAVNQLNAFVNEVNTQRGGSLTNEQANTLIQMTQKIISAITG